VRGDRGVNSVEGADGRDTEPVARETHAIACAANRVAVIRKPPTGWVGVVHLHVADRA
jgi:hypothetical protein